MLNKNSLDKDKKIFQKIFETNKIIAGVDEAGRGPLAGPLVVGLVVHNPNIDLSNFKVGDSKKLSDTDRRKTFEFIKNKLIWAVGVVSSDFIDRHGITKSVSYGVDLALGKLETTPNFLMLDGRIKINQQENFKHQEFIKGDQRFEIISLASIIAKVYRDDLMLKYDKAFPQYEFVKHKGYGTKIHYEKIKKYGPCKIHRQSFRLF